MQKLMKSESIMWFLLTPSWFLEIVCLSIALVEKGSHSVTKSER